MDNPNAANQKQDGATNNLSAATQQKFTPWQMKCLADIRQQHGNTPIGDTLVKRAEETYAEMNRLGMK